MRWGEHRRVLVDLDLDTVFLDVDRLGVGGDHDGRLFLGLATHCNVQAEHAGSQDRTGCAVAAASRCNRIRDRLDVDHDLFGGVIALGRSGGVNIHLVVSIHARTLPTWRPTGVWREGVSSLRSLWRVPEGDTIHRAGAALRTALTGRAITRFDAPRLYGPRPAIGRVIERIETHGKHLEILWDDGIVLHTHLRMNGSWHLYRTGERWRRPSDQMRVAIEVPGWVAACFNAPTVETYREFDRFRHPGMGRPGPDLCTAPDEKLMECARGIYEYAEPECPISEVLLDQHVACGVGNVYRSEILWACELSPFAEVGSLLPVDCVQLIHAASRTLRANLQAEYQVTTSEATGGLAVYGRNGQRCSRCADTVEVRRVGEHARPLYHCPGCQVRYRPPVVTAVPLPKDQVMDPHPAAEKYLADLPWRRGSLAG